MMLNNTCTWHPPQTPGQTIKDNYFYDEPTPLSDGPYVPTDGAKATGAQESAATGSLEIILTCGIESISLRLDGLFLIPWTMVEIFSSLSLSAISLMKQSDAFPRGSSVTLNSQMARAWVLKVASRAEALFRALINLSFGGTTSKVIIQNLLGNATKKEVCA